MEISTNKTSFLLFIAAMAVFMGVVAIFLIKKPKVELSTSFEREIQQLKSQSDSNEIYSIENDIMETDLEDLDKELTSIEKELEASY